MRSVLLCAAIAFSCCLLVGCGGSEATAPGANELENYIDENPDKIAAQEEIDAREDADDDDDDDD